MIAFAAVSALVAVPVVVVAVVTLILFFAGRGTRYGDLNDLVSAIGLLLLVAPAVAVQLITEHAAGAWLVLVTGASIAGMLLAAGGQLLLVARRISLGTSFVTGGIGIAPVLLWIGVTAWLALGARALPEPVGWSGSLLLGSAALVSVAAWLKQRRATWALSGLLAFALVWWLGALTAALFGSA